MPHTIFVSSCETLPRHSRDDPPSRRFRHRKHRPPSLTSAALCAFAPLREPPPKAAPFLLRVSAPPREQSPLRTEERHIHLDIMNHLGYMARASSPKPYNRKDPGAHRPFPCRQANAAGARRMRQGAVMPRIVDATRARRGRSDADRLPLALLATAGNGHGTTGKGTRGRPSARRQAAARQAGFPCVRAFSRLSAGRRNEDTSPVWQSIPEGPSRSAAAQRLSGHSPAP